MIGLPRFKPAVELIQIRAIAFYYSITGLMGLILEISQSAD